ncbi:MAG: hypothetical protein RIA64_12020 [Rhodospirillales bacterium]
MTSLMALQTNYPDSSRRTRGCSMAATEQGSQDMKQTGTMRLMFAAAVMTMAISAAGQALADPGDAGCPGNPSGYGMMGPGMMGPGMMGPGMMGPGMMGQGWGGQGWMGPGMMMNQGMMGPGMMMNPGQGAGPNMMNQGMMGGQGAGRRQLDEGAVKKILEGRLAWFGNDSLKVGEVKKQGDNGIVAEIIGKDDKVIEKYLFNRYSGWSQRIQ